MTSTASLPPPETRQGGSTCRLSVFLARRSDVAVILRRGPSEWSQLVTWQRGDDSFTPGQWFHGRVYGRRCDLSPSGRYFVYFAAKHGRTQPDPDGIGEAWTAISRPPYFTALALWTNLGSWYGGGVFREDDEVILDATCTLTPHPKFPVRKLKIAPMGGVTSPWEQRLQASGWGLVERGFDPRTHQRVGRLEIWRKTDPATGWTLYRELEDVDFTRHGGPYFESFWLERGDVLVPLDAATWADWDRAVRLVFVRDGRLLAAHPADGFTNETVLIDLNPMQPQEVTPPDWARRW